MQRRRDVWAGLGGGYGGGRRVDVDCRRWVRRSAGAVDVALELRAVRVDLGHPRLNPLPQRPNHGPQSRKAVVGNPQIAVGRVLTHFRCL